MTAQLDAFIIPVGAEELRGMTTIANVFSDKLSGRFDPPLARATDPATSFDGEADVAPRRKSQKERLLDAYRDNGPMTAERACQVAGLERGGWKRVSELVKEGKLGWTGGVLPNESGSDAHVFRITT